MNRRVVNRKNVTIRVKLSNIQRGVTIKYSQETLRVIVPPVQAALVSDGCGQYREVLQGGLDGLVDGPLGLVGAVAVSRAQGLELGQVAVEVLVAHLVRGGHHRARLIRYAHVFQQGYHVVAYGLVVIV